MKGDNMNQKIEREGLDIAKFIAALIVVMIHTHPLLGFGKEVDYYSTNVFGRVAVAFFFLCSGYFTFSRMHYNNGKLQNSKENRKILWKTEKRIIEMYTIWSVIYFFVEILKWNSSKNISFFHFLVSFGMSFLIYGSFYQLWYLLAMIYGIPIIYCLLIKLGIKNVQILGIGLYLIHLLINVNEVIPNNVIRNIIGNVNFLPGSAVASAFYIGIPFMIWGFGVCIDKSINKKYCLGMMFISIIGLSVEAFVFYNKFEISDVTYYFFTVGIAVPLFLLLAEVEISGKRVILLRNLSTIIYCIHPLWIEIYKNIINKSDYIVKFVWTAFGSVLSGVIIILLSKKIPNIKKIY